MELYNFRPLPRTFNLKNVAEITSHVCGSGTASPHGDQVGETLRNWFMRYDFLSEIYDEYTK